MVEIAPEGGDGSDGDEDAIEVSDDGGGGGTDFDPTTPGTQPPPSTGGGHGIDGPGTPPDSTSGPTGGGDDDDGAPDFRPDIPGDQPPPTTGGGHGIDGVGTPSDETSGPIGPTDREFGDSGGPAPDDGPTLTDELNRPVAPDETTATTPTRSQRVDVLERRAREVAPDLQRGSDYVIVSGPGGDPRLEFTRRGARNVTRAQVTAMSELIDPGDVRVEERDGVFSASVNEATAATLAASGWGQGAGFVLAGGLTGMTGTGGEDVGFQGGDPESQLVARIEREIERAVGRQRAAAAGVTNPRLREAYVDSATPDLERGRDFTVQLVRGEAGVQVEAGLTEERARAEARHALEQTVFRQTGLALEAGRDFRVVEGEEGAYRAELTAAGETRLDTAGLTEAVEGAEEAVGREFPNIGPQARDTRATRDFGQRDVVVPGLAPGAAGAGLGAFGEAATGPTRRTGEATTLEAEVGALLQGIDEAVEPETGAFAGRYLTTEQRARFLEGRDITNARTAIAGEFVERAAEAPASLPLGGVLLFKNAAEFSAAVGGAVRRGDVDRVSQLYGDLGQTAINTAAVGASRFAEAPGRTAAGAVGTLAGSAFLFAGAAAVGSRTSLATRALVQPGEEALGYGGYGLTRRIAGRGAAERFFPNREPLIFSEEAAIRGARRALRGGQRLSSRVTVEPRAFGTGPPKLRMKTELETELEESLRLMERAQEAEVPISPDYGTFVNREGELVTEADMERARREAETPELGAEARTRAETAEMLAQAQRSEVLAVAGALERQAVLERGRLDTRFEPRGELELRLEAEAEAEGEAEARARAEARAEAELETDFEFESALEAEIETDDREPYRPWEATDAALPGAVDEADSPLASGWLNEAIVAFALGAGPREAPSEAMLADVGGDGFTEQLPTLVELTGTEQQQAAIAEAREFFYAGGDEDGEPLL